jgi:hypothetical protein
MYVMVFVASHVNVFVASCVSKVARAFGGMSEMYVVLTPSSLPMCRLDVY